MDVRVSVHLARARLQYWYSKPFGKAEHVHRSYNAGLGSLNRIELVVDGTGRTSQVIYFIYFNVEREGDIVTQDFKVRMIEKVGNVSLGPGKEVVNANDLTSRIKQLLAQVASKKSRAARNQNPAHQVPVTMHTAPLKY
jgi:hypothetical protein